mmetsp:Transcript_71880/g.206425  ORF Transcript_71880/g.206425 Transcript_71880/m.206425 type:complete len:240 (+) Transcript_71880:832-1551(+)
MHVVPMHRRVQLAVLRAELAHGRVLRVGADRHDGHTEARLAVQRRNGGLHGLVVQGPHSAGQRAPGQHHIPTLHGPRRALAEPLVAHEDEAQLQEGQGPAKPTFQGEQPRQREVRGDERRQASEGLGKGRRGHSQKRVHPGDRGGGPLREDEGAGAVELVGVGAPGEVRGADKTGALLGSRDLRVVAHRQRRGQRRQRQLRASHGRDGGGPGEGGAATEPPPRCSGPTRQPTEAAPCGP